jgi:hypothetical protein
MLSGDFSAIPLTLGGPFQTVNGKPNQVNPALYSKGALAFDQLLPLGQASDGEVNVTDPVSTYSYNENTDRLNYSVTGTQRITLRSFIQYDTQPPSLSSGQFTYHCAGRYHPLFQRAVEPHVGNHAFFG